MDDGRESPGAFRLPSLALRGCEKFVTWRVKRTPARRFLENEIAALFRDLRPSRLLFVGCKCYTHGYGDLFGAPETELWTLDIDPRAAKWGVPAVF